ncbi:hypothetical protein GDO86_002347 [Hymenochirus boettgeri]|uniref:polynucleotide adenylyltransferase n=1 Tax=Hymenochirus boettgeri TaxID=247094 RepID=A0A8T2KI24_9PIPI|nr:hypothetical protein GDO86_002347 [Hymenochirus boettgeri]
MFPNSPGLGLSPQPYSQQQCRNLLTKLPVGLPPELLNPEQLLQAHINLQKNANHSRMLVNGNVLSVPPVTSPPWSYGNHNPLSSPGFSFQNRKRRSDERNVPYDVKRQRFHSPQQNTLIHQAVPLRDDHRFSFPGSLAFPLLQTPTTQNLNGRNSSGDSWLFDHVNTTLPVAKDKLSQQILDLFQACQQQVCDLQKKDICRAELQREIQQMFPQSRLYLVGSSLNGFGSRSSDADLCLVLKDEPMNQKTEARHILGLLQKHFHNRLSYIERPQLIRAKVPIVKFRDKVSGVEFDLNVNNVVGIRNTFLLRTYAHLENRIQPLVLVVKKWASYNGINDASRGTLSSYTLVLMVLHYLQTLPEPILPSLQKNYPECFNPTMQLHLVHQAPRNIPQYFSKNETSLGDLLVGFFKYFAVEFDWKKSIISVRESKAIPRTDGLEWRNKFICVEEPFDRTTLQELFRKQKFDTIKAEFLKGWVRLRDNKDLNSVMPLRGMLKNQ